MDDRRAASALGIRVDVVFSLMFALGTGLAGLGGALGIDVLGLDPTFPVKYMVYFLLVVAVGGAGSIKGTLAAALILTGKRLIVTEVGAVIGAHVGPGLLAVVISQREQF